MPRRPNVVNFDDRRRVCGRRVVFAKADLDVWYLTRVMLRLGRPRRRQLALLAECLLLEDEQTSLQLDVACSAAGLAPCPKTPPSPDRE